MCSYDFVTADKFGKNGWPFFWSLVLEFGSFLSLAGLDMAPWQKVDLTTLSGITLQIQHHTQREVTARLWNARKWSWSLYKYYAGGDVQIAWRLVAFSALSSSLCKEFHNAKANRRRGTSSRCLLCYVVTAALSDQPLNGCSAVACILNLLINVHYMTTCVECE